MRKDPPLIGIITQIKRTESLYWAVDLSKKPITIVSTNKIMILATEKNAEICAQNALNILSSKDLIFSLKIDGLEILIDRAANPALFFLMSVLLHENIFQNNLIKHSKDNIFIYNSIIVAMIKLWKRLNPFESSAILNFSKEKIMFFVFIDYFQQLRNLEVNNQSVERMYNFLLEERGVLSEKIKARRVAIYGAGKIGLLLESVFNENGITTICFIDRNNNNIDAPTPIIKPEHINDDEIDLIVVTPVFDFENIEEYMRNFSVSRIVSLEELF